MDSIINFFIFMVNYKCMLWRGLLNRNLLTLEEKKVSLLQNLRNIEVKSLDIKKEIFGTS